MPATTTTAPEQQLAQLMSLAQARTAELHLLLEQAASCCSQAQGLAPEITALRVVLDWVEDLRGPLNRLWDAVGDD